MSSSCAIVAKKKKITKKSSHLIHNAHLLNVFRNKNSLKKKFLPQKNECTIAILITISRDDATGAQW